MTSKNVETQLGEMGAALTKIEARLETNETRQNTTAQRMEELYKASVERLNAKDDTTARLREQSEWTLKQNDTLLKQIGLRWNLLTGLTGFLTLAFSLVFVYQIWRVEQVMPTAPWSRVTSLWPRSRATSSQRGLQQPIAPAEWAWSSGQKSWSGREQC